MKAIVSYALEDLVFLSIAAPPWKLRKLKGNKNNFDIQMANHSKMHYSFACESFPFFHLIKILEKIIKFIGLMQKWDG